MIKIRVVVLIFSCLTLTGCASLQLVSLGASGLSYVVTGKSISDHAISTVLKKDCALHRSIIGKQTCIEHDGDGVIRGSMPGREIVVAKEDSWQVAPQVAVQNTQNSQHQLIIPKSRQLPPINHPKFKQTSISPHQTVLELMAQQKHQQDNAHTANDVNSVSRVESTTIKRVSERTSTPQLVVNEQPSVFAITKPSSYQDKPALYAVVGSYNNKHFAQNNIAKQNRINQSITGQNTAKLVINDIDSIGQGAPKYRVVIGPLAPEQFSTSLGDVGENPNHKAWRMTLCQQSLLPPPCDSDLFVANR